MTQTVKDVLLIAAAVAIACAIVFCFSGCALHSGQQLQPRTSVSIAYDPQLEAQCLRMNREVIGFTATAIGLGTAGAATGIPAMLTSDVPRWATGVTSAVTSVGAAVFTALANLEAANYTRMCTVGATGAK